MKAERLLATLREQYKEWEDDKEGEEYTALFHAFCFISYNVGDFQKYLDEMSSRKSAKE
ncbi:MAG: hypothetical protein JJU11_04870 [Candidatus Sumerlaeia bacterium]|nr:hypothetical protein [Candidatus Sumerlaeia bacterium]